MRKDVARVGHRLLDISRGVCGHHRDVVRFEQVLDLDGFEPLAAVCDGSSDDLLRTTCVRHESVGHCGWNLAQLLHDFAMPHEVHEAAHGVVFGRIVRNAGAGQCFDDVLVCSDPRSEHGLGPTAVLLAICLGAFGHHRCDIGSRGDRGLHVEDEDRVVVGIGEQHVQRRRIARRIGVAHDVDGICAGPGRRQHLIEFLAGVRRDRRRNSAELDQSIDGEDTDAAAIGQDGEALSRRRLDAAERLGAIEQLAQIGDPQDARAAERRVIDGVSAGECTGMGGGRLRALRHAAGLHHDDRLHARRGTRGRHELAGVLDGFDVEQNRAGLVIHREIVEQIGNIDIDLIADRDDAGEADAALRGPIDHAGRDRARLRNQREISRPRHVRGKTRIEAHAGHHDAQAVRPDQPHAVFAGRSDRGLLQGPRSVTEPGRDDQRARRAASSGLIDNAGNRARRRRDDHKLRHERQLVEAVHRRDAADLGMTRIDEAELSREASLLNVLQNGASNGDRAGARTDERDRTRRQQVLQTIG